MYTSIGIMKIIMEIRINTLRSLSFAVIFPFFSIGSSIAKPYDLTAQRFAVEPPGRLCSHGFSIQQRSNEDTMRLNPWPKARSVPTAGWAIYSSEDVQIYLKNKYDLLISVGAL